MAATTEIEWTDATWNPVTGCTQISAGCDNCYAKRFSERFRGTAGHPFEHGFDLRLRADKVGQPLKWRKGRRIFVNSMSDLFHKRIPSGFIDEVFETMEEANWHQFQVLSKRSSIMRDYTNRRYGKLQAPEHIWLGVSIEDARSKARVKHLQQTNASIKFVSIEPLIGRIGCIDLSGIDWVIVGGESGPKARPLDADWVREIRDQCAENDIPFFFKQWGGMRPKSGGRKIDGREWNGFPEPPAAASSC
jgi:protein gp37